jgi:hypothetical protein
MKIKKQEEKILDKNCNLRLQHETLINLITIEDSEKDFVDSFIKNQNITDFTSKFRNM